MKVSPDPTEEEAVAIVAALEAAWPKAVVVEDAAAQRWRWSGRWWSKPVPLSRRRPW
ncbi:MAG TPA: hypothetical protein VF228_10815 [Iamia sp.]